MKKCGLIKNNIGMTLVELLVALAIFVAAIIPMLYAFVYSTGFNFKAQQTMQSTGIAQAIIEKCKGSNTDFKTISDALADGSILTANARFSMSGNSHPSTNVYHFDDVKATTFAGAVVNDAVDNGSTTRRAYDVVVTIKEAEDGAGSVSYTDYSSMISMRSGATGNFVNADTLLAQDAVAQDEVLDQLYIDVIQNGTVTAGPGMSTDGTDYFNRDDFVIKNLYIKRVFSITASDDGVKLSVDYYYKGYVDNLGAFSDQIVLKTNSGGYNVTCTATPSTSTAIYHASLGFTDDWLVGGPTAPVISPACYIYYYPSYDYTLCPTSTQCNTIAKFEDEFDIDNQMNTSYYAGTAQDERFECYIFKQYNADLDDATANPGINLETLDDHYVPTVNMTSAGSIYTDLYHNFLWNVTDGDDMPAAYQPVINANFSLGCFNMTYAERSGHTNAGPVSGDYVATKYSTYFCQTSPRGESPILRDKAVLPMYSAFRGVGSSIPMFVPRIEITVEVFARNDTHTHTGETPIETMTAEFVNW
jgi:type II secretory pathway pseudopilin PulG